MEIKH